MSVAQMPPTSRFAETVVK